VRSDAQGLFLYSRDIGAIASGKHRLNIAGKLKSIPEKQAAAAVGQGRLMRVYSKSLKKIIFMSPRFC